MLSHNGPDEILIDNLIQRERTTRDTARWQDMTDCYSPDSSVEVSWFQGSGKDFAKLSSKMAGGMIETFHLMCPAVVTPKGDRALAETACAVHGITELDGVEIDIVSHSRLLWRAQRQGPDWTLAGMRAYCLNDAIVPADPTRIPKIDHGLLAGLRRSYRSIAYVMAKSGFPVRDDLPGIDKPQTVASLRSREELWLADI